MPERRRVAGLRLVAAIVLAAAGVGATAQSAAAAGQPPTLTSASASSGSTAGGATITVRGRDFTRASVVFFSTTPAARMRYVSPTELRARVPAHAAGTVYLHAHDRYGTSPATTAARYTFRAPCTSSVVHVSGTVRRSTTWDCSRVHQLDGAVTVPTGVTLTITAGTTVLAAPGAGISAAGSLVASGTPTAPVTFTATDTGSDGTRWAGISVDGGAHADLRGVRLTHASTALAVVDDGSVSARVVVRGSITDSGTGVSSDASVVDARAVNWGDRSGPAPFGSGTAVSGAGVFVTPWVGYTDPATATAQTSSTEDADHSCADVLFVGARGSDEDPRGNAVYSADTADRTLLGARVAPILDAMRSGLGAGTTVRVLGLRYPADGPPYGSFSTPAAYYYQSIYDGVAELRSVLAREHGYCPAERIVLAGYSQGALVIHLALAQLAASGTLSRYPIAAVELVSDPARTRTGTETRLGTAQRTADGIWGLEHGDPALPAALVARTTTICHRNDPVCDAADRQRSGRYVLNVDARADQHSNYPSGDELVPLGDAAARHVRSG